MTTSNEHNNAPAVPQNTDHFEDDLYMVAPFGYFRPEPFGWTDCAKDDEGAIALYEHPAAPAVPQGWKIDRDGADAIVISHHAVGLAKACNSPRSAHEHLLFMLCDDILQDGDTLAPAPAPAQEVATLSLSAEDVHAAFTKNFPKSRISQAWINFAADIAQAIAARAAKPAQEVGLTDERLLERLKHYPNWELSTSNDPECDPSVFWLVHEVKGGRNDREWFLIGEGDSPRAAIIAALRAKGGK